MKEEGLKETNNNRIFVGEPIIFDDDEFVEAVENLDCLAKQECKEIREEVKKLVPTYEYKE